MYISNTRRFTKFPAAERKKQCDTKSTASLAVFIQEHELHCSSSVRHCQHWYRTHRSYCMQLIGINELIG